MITKFSNFKQNMNIQESEIEYDEVLKTWRTIPYSEKINRLSKVPDSNLVAFMFKMNENKKIEEYHVYLIDNCDIFFNEDKVVLNIKFTDPIFEKRKIVDVCFNNEMQKKPCIQFEDFKIEFKIEMEKLSMSGIQLFELSSSLYEKISYSVDGDIFTFHIKLSDFFEDNTDYAPQLSDLKKQYGRIDMFGKHIK